MDLALTYHCNNDCAHCYNARVRNYPELSTGSWKSILDKIWSLKIPHVVFTGGEPTLRPDLLELVAYAQQTGLVAGLNTNGRKLSDPAYIAGLVEAGLDHVQITLESNRAEVHDHMVRAKGAWEQTVQGVKNAVSSKLYLMTNTTLLENNKAYLLELLTFLRDLGVPTVGLNALIYSGKGTTVNTGLQEQDLPNLLEIATDFTQKSGQRLIWYTPTQYCHFECASSRMVRSSPASLTTKLSGISWQLRGQPSGNTRLRSLCGNARMFRKHAKPAIFSRSAVAAARWLVTIRTRSKSIAILC